MLDLLQRDVYYFVLMVYVLCILCLFLQVFALLYLFFSMSFTWVRGLTSME